MTTLPSHERPILLLVPGPQALSEAIRAICGHEDVRAYAFPAVWDLSFGRVDAMSLCPDVRRVDLDNLDALLARLTAAATPGALAAWTREVWAAIPDRVREHFLRRGGFAIFAAAFRVDGAPATVIVHKGKVVRVIQGLGREAEDFGTHGVAG